MKSHDVRASNDVVAGIGPATMLLRCCAMTLTLAFMLTECATTSRQCTYPMKGGAICASIAPRQFGVRPNAPSNKSVDDRTR